jgi:hypothetical protein
MRFTNNRRVDFPVRSDSLISACVRHMMWIRMKNLASMCTFLCNEKRMVGSLSCPQPEIPLTPALSQRERESYWQLVSKDQRSICFTCRPVLFRLPLERVG